MRALALRHVAFEHLGAIRPALERAGYEIDEIDVPATGVPAADALAADLLVVLGGPVGVYDDGTFPLLATERAVLAERMRAGGPTLGICLGAQLMAAALGARVYRGPVTEIGFFDDVAVEGPLAPLAGVPVLQWHGDTFDLPVGATRLARSRRYENQAFAVGDSALALQFHPEVDAPMLEQWLLGNIVELVAAGIDVDGLRAAGLRHAAAQTDALQPVLDAWLAGLRARRAA